MTCEGESELFETLSSSLILKCSDSTNELSLVHQNEESTQDVHQMERVGSCVLDLFKSNADVANQLGTFFLQCLEHLAEELCKTTNYKSVKDLNVSQVTVAGREEKKNPKSSSVLLDCEQDSHLEAYNNALVLYITAALCEHVTEDVLKSADLHTLLTTISTVVGCHAHFCSNTLTKQHGSSILQITGPSLEELLGGPITLNIAFGLLSAILGGAREVRF